MASAFDDRTSNIQVEAEGTVIRILPNDLIGGRHQRFIVRLKSGQTPLVAHNIDLARCVSGVRESNEVAFSGECELNPEGGVIHWTHRDPQGRHPAGWIRHEEQTYR